MEVAGLQAVAFASSPVAVKAVSSRLVEAGRVEHSLAARTVSLRAAELEAVQSMVAEVGLAVAQVVWMGQASEIAVAVAVDSTVA